jgi:hypothetical protein
MCYAWERRGKCTVLVGKPEGKRPLRKPRRRWRMGSEWILWIVAVGGGCVCVEWVQLAQDRGQWWDFVNMVMNLRVLAPQS